MSAIEIRLATAFLILFATTAAVSIAAAQTWSKITPGGDAPSPRINAGAVYDPIEHRIIIYGGRGADGDVDDMWAFDLATEQWSPMEQTSGGGPGPRYTHNMLYDPDQHQLILWSGRHTTSSSISFNDVWSFDLATERWTLQAPAADQPNARYGTAAVLDPRSRELVNFAGFTEAGRFDDTWRFAVDTSEWTEIATGDVKPGRRCLHMSSYDAREHRMLIFGGAGAPTGRWDDMWAFDLATATWSDLSPDQRPSGRSFPTHIYDPVGHRALVFGGSPSGSQVSDELWSFDLATNTWEILAVEAETPEAREGAAAVYVPSEGRMILFAGRGDDGNLNDLWTLDGLGTVPTTVGEAGQMVPSEPGLSQNRPNPFNGATVIPYDLRADGPVRVAIHDLLGRHVKTLVNGSAAAGSYTATWDGTEDSGLATASGIYFSRLESGDGIFSRKLLFIK